MTTYTLDEVREALAAGKTLDPDETIVTANAEIKVADDANRTVRFRITTDAVDRANDLINPKGWDVKSYKKNPVVLFGHDHRDMPVARTIRLTKDKTGMSATAQFVPEDVPVVGERAEAIRRLIKGGFINTASVGFRPLKFSFNSERGGIDFEKQELLEWSFVSVPMNQEATVEQRALAETAFNWDEEGDVPSKAAGTIEVDLKVNTEEVTAAIEAINGATDDQLRALCAERGIALADPQPVERDVEEVIIDEAPAEQTPSRDEVLLAAIGRLTEAVEKMQPAPVVERDDDETVLELVVEEQDDLLEFDGSILGEAATAALQNSLRSIAVDATRDAINKARGRVD